MAEPSLFTPEEIAEQMDNSDIEGKQFLHDPELEKLANKVIKEQKLELGPSQIDYLVVYPNISKKVAGKCKKCGKELRFYTGYHYIIQVSGELWELLNKEQKYILVFHELLHVQPEYSAKTKEWKFKIRPHDFEDFWEIYKKYGIDWIGEIGEEVDALYDLKPTDRVKM